MRLLPVFWLLLSLVSQLARADPPRADHNYWRNTIYPDHYVLYDAPTLTWIETVNCTLLNRFKQVVSETNSLTLLDASRGMTMRLDYQGMYLKAQGATQFTLYQPGTFDTRHSYSHFDGAGAYTGNISRTHNCRWQEWFPGAAGPAFSFEQSTVAADRVDLYDGGRNLLVRLTPTQMLMAPGGKPLQFFKRGGWQ